MKKKLNLDLIISTIGLLLGIINLFLSNISGVSITLFICLITIWISKLDKKTIKKKGLYGKNNNRRKIKRR